MALSLQILRIVDYDYYPGWVECEFFDATGRRHQIVDKIPIFTEKLLEPEDSYAQPGIVQCNIISQFRDEENRELAKIVIEVESTEEITEFTVLSEQLQHNPWQRSS